MKLKYTWNTILILFCLLVWPLDSGYSKDSIKWYNYNRGIALGKAKKKIVFLHFYADWCGYCKKMTKETFQAPSVIEYLRTNFVSIRVNADKERNVAFDYGIRGLPTTWFIKKNGEKVGPLPGYIPPDRMLLILKEIHTTQNIANPKN